LPGRVWMSKKAEWLREGHKGLTRNPRRAELMQEIGFKARMAIPILADEEVVAVLEFAMQAEREEDAGLLNLATIIAGQLGNAIRRKQAEEALRDGEERYRALVESVDAIVWQADPETMRATYMSPQTERILGYAVKDWLSSPTFWKDHLHPDDREQAVAYCVNAIREGRGYEFEYRMLAADGRVLWFRDKVTVVTQDGRAVQLHGIMLDITAAKRTAQDLYDSEERYRTFIQNSVEIIYFFDLHTDGILEGNPAFQKLLGYSADEAKKLTLYDFVDHDKESIRAFSQKILEKGGGFPIGERTWRTKNGMHKHVRVTVGRIKQKERVIGFAIARDVTDAKMMAQSLSDSEVRYKALIDNSMEAIYLYDPDTKVLLDANPAFLNLLGYRREDVGSISMHDFIMHARNTVGSFTQHFAVGETGAIMIGERTWVGKNGIRRDMDVTAGRMHQGGKTIGFTVARDITEQKRTQERLTYLAHYDELTGLPNRTLFNENLRQILVDSQRRQRLVAVMFLDLDRFKTINDTLGHETGDTLLKAVAERLRQSVRRGDVIARLGGDEFTIALADVAQADDVALVAKKILESFAYPFQIGGRDLFVTTSIGIGLYPQDHEQADGLLKSADAAMYRAKELGRNNYQFYTKELNAQASKRLALETHLRRALERNEFFLNYQPQVDLRTGEMVGMEALIRWQNPELGLVSPADFIPLAEETGLIVPIGDWVLRTACNQNKAWQKAGLPALRISVNLSARQFREKNLIDTVRQILDQTGLAPKYLELELTESLLQHVETAELVLKELHNLGVHLSVDDFGTGYSSLNYLKRFPIDNLKIDRSFVRDVINDPDDAAITDAIITMAHTLGIYVVAEGVETREQLAFLHQHRCDLVQGYYFSKPLPAEAFVELLRSGRKLMPSDWASAASKKTAQG
jgi:diguanylate cyclase (GGDEF)-like protein/PAS domain S-box-containing protein